MKPVKLKVQDATVIPFKTPTVRLFGGVGRVFNIPLKIPVDS